MFIDIIHVIETKKINMKIYNKNQTYIKTIIKMVCKAAYREPPVTSGIYYYYYYYYYY